MTTASTKLESGRQWARLVLAAIYLVAGILHVTRPAVFLEITPGWVPYPQQVILFTGLCEIAGAVGLLTRKLRYAAGVGLAIYAVCVFPANIKHAIDGLPPGQIQLGLWYHIPRLMLQPVLVWWALFASALINWPLQHCARRTRNDVTPPAE